MTRMVDATGDDERGHVITTGEGHDVEVIVADLATGITVRQAWVDDDYVVVTAGRAHWVGSRLVVRGDGWTEHVLRIRFPS